MSEAALEQQETRAKGTQIEQKEANQGGRYIENGNLIKDLSDKDFKQFLAAGGGEKGNVLGFPLAADILPSPESKVGKAPDGATVTENPDGPFRVAGVKTEGKSYTVDFPDPMTSNGPVLTLPKITDSQGHIVPYLDGNVVDPLAEEIQGNALSDKKQFDAQSTLDKLDLSPTEKQEISSMVDELKSGNLPDFQQTASQLAAKYNAQQFQQEFDGLKATATLSDVPGDLNYPIYDQGTIGGEVPKGGGVLMYLSPEALENNGPERQSSGGGPLATEPGEVAVLFSP
jgi:hypothetical protein